MVFAPFQVQVLFLSDEHESGGGGGGGNYCSLYSASNYLSH